MMFSEETRANKIKLQMQTKFYLQGPYEQTSLGQAEEEGEDEEQKEYAFEGDSVMYQLPCLKGDKARLTQVLINLIKNAIKHTQKGQITIKSAYNFIDGMLVIHVCDTGKGISSSEFDKLFKRFSKLDDPLNQNSDGYGLGLNICEAIVNANEGQI